MPIKESAKKNLRKSLRRKKINLRRKEAIKDVVKKLKKSVKDKNKEGAHSFMPSVFKAYDKAAKTGVIKKNTAARKKSRMSRMVNSAFK